jgi:hypothetical protein
MDLQEAQRLINGLVENEKFCDEPMDIEGALAVYLQAVVDLERGGETFLVDYGWSNVYEKRTSRGGHSTTVHHVLRNLLTISVTRDTLICELRRLW